ncbi:MAG: hypothetical protein LC781_21795 [Actinobacteria bacterium]|nr:hypothetical protein [Actinomycetota bacterium]
MEQVENDATFRELLESWCAARRHLITPEREQRALDALVKEAARYPRAVQHAF